MAAQPRKPEEILKELTAIRVDDSLENTLMDHLRLETEAANTKAMREVRDRKLYGSEVPYPPSLPLQLADILTELQKNTAPATPVVKQTLAKLPAVLMAMRDEEDRWAANPSGSAGDFLSHERLFPLLSEDKIQDRLRVRSEDTKASLARRAQLEAARVLAAELCDALGIKPQELGGRGRM